MQQFHENLNLKFHSHLASGIPGVEQNNPTEAPGTENLEVDVAMAISQIETNWHPAAAAIPST